MLTYDKVRLNNEAWQIFYRTADSISVLSPEEVQEQYSLAIRKAAVYRLFSIRTKHDYRTGKLVAFAVAYGNTLSSIRRNVFISVDASNGDIAELKYRCSADFVEERAAA